jgi:hypothetical protein
MKRSSKATKGERPQRRQVQRADSSAHAQRQSAADTGTGKNTHKEMPLITSCFLASPAARGRSLPSARRPLDYTPLAHGALAAGVGRAEAHNQQTRTTRRETVGRRSGQEVDSLPLIVFVVCLRPLGRPPPDFFCSLLSPLLSFAMSFAVRRIATIVPGSDARTQCWGIWSRAMALS